MPGREHGLYGSWRALVASDPALRRLRLPQERFTDLPERPEHAVLGALAALNVPEGEHRGELRSQLALTREGHADRVRQARRLGSDVERNDLLKNYFDGGWVSLALREGPGRPWQRRRRDGEWETWTPALPAEREVMAAAGTGSGEEGPAQG